MKLVLKSLLLLSILFVVSTQTFADGGEPALNDSNVATLQEPFTFKFKNNATLKYYGKIEMVSYYDTTTPFVSDWLAFVYPDTNYDGTQESFSMAVRASLFGFNFNLPDVWGSADLNAKLEMDFVGGYSTGTTTAYTPLVRMKQAWFSLDTEHFSFLAGQAFGVFGPLFPDNCAWIALGSSGNPWIRVPQLRVTVKDKHWKWEVSANRSMAFDETLGGTLDDIMSDGEQSALPMMMSRLGYTGKIGSVDVATGISGTYGREKYYRNSATAVIDKDLSYYMGVFDLFLGSKYVDFKGEAFYGENLNTFYAGILQGVTESDANADGINDDVNGIGSMGGWAQFTFKPTSKWAFNLGGGIEDTDNADLAATGRAYNFTGYVNGIYKPSKWLSFTLEPCFTRTGYNGGTSNDNIRGTFRTAFMF